MHVKEENSRQEREKRGDNASINPLLQNTSSISFTFGHLSLSLILQLI